MSDEKEFELSDFDVLSAYKATDTDKIWRGRVNGLLREIWKLVDNNHKIALEVERISNTNISTSEFGQLKAHINIVKELIEDDESDIEKCRNCIELIRLNLLTSLLNFQKILKDAEKAIEEAENGTQK